MKTEQWICPHESYLIVVKIIQYKSKEVSKQDNFILWKVYKEINKVLR